jgi:DNA-binding XRE family transcriptional regulator
MFRCNHKLTQAEMAVKIGVCRATYSFIERGIRSGTAEFWAKLQSVFNVPDEDMYKLMKLEGKLCEETEDK